MRIDKTKIGKVLLGLLVSGCIFISCHRDSPSWDTQILAPVVNASLSINDIITSSYIKNNPDSTVSLVFTDSLYNLNIDTLVTIPDTVLSYFETTPFSTTLTPGEEMFATNPTTTTYPIGSVELTKGILQSGFLIFKVRNPLPQPIDYIYKVLNVIKGTDTLEIDTVIKAYDSLNVQKSLSGYTVDFTGPHHNGYNDITTSIQVNLDPRASSLTVVSGDTIVFANVSFSNIIPYYAKGYFGTTTKSFGPQNEAFSVFNKIVAGTLNLQNVNVNLTLTNAFGVDASLKLSQLSSYNSRTNTTVNLVDNAVVGSTIHVDRATATNSPAPASPVIPYAETFSLTPANSNILTWLDNLPTAVGYALQVTTDPPPVGNEGFSDFAYYGYGISANINVTIPLSLIANNLTLADTLAVNFAGSAATTQHVKSGTLTIYANNGFPFSAGLQLYLLNKSNIIYDSLFIPTTQTIAAAPVNAVTGIVSNSQSSVLTISLDAAHTQELFNTKNIILHARFNMGNLPSTYRKIYDYYQLGLKLVGNFDYQVN